MRDRPCWHGPCFERPRLCRRASAEPGSPALVSLHPTSFCGRPAILSCRSSSTIIHQARLRKMNFTRPFWAGLLPALALCGALLCSSIVSAQEAAPETKKEEPAAAKTEEPKAEAPK